MITLDNLTPRLSELLENHPMKDIPGIAQGIMRIFGYETVPEDFFKFDLYTDNPSITINGEYINEVGLIIFPTVLEKAMQSVTDRILDMDEDEFRKALDKHADGPISKLHLYTEGEDE